MWRSGGDIGNGFGGALSEAHQWFAKNNLSTLHPWGAVPISRPGCWGYPDSKYLSAGAFGRLVFPRLYNVRLSFGRPVMEIGNFCSDAPGRNLQCENEERAHMGLWCIVRLITIDPFCTQISDRAAFVVDISAFFSNSIFSLP